jgi:hypothetical protein
MPVTAGTPAWNSRDTRNRRDPNKSRNCGNCRDASMSSRDTRNRRDANKSRYVSRDANKNRYARNGRDASMQ